MENALYYTFSTIAQALAGAVALLAAFVLFKLQNIDSELEKLAGPMASATEELRGHYELGHLAKFCAALTPGLAGGVHDKRIERLRALVKTREGLVSSLKLAIPLTLGTMVVAIVILALVPILADCLWLSRLILLDGCCAGTARARD